MKQKYEFYLTGEEEHQIQMYLFGFRSIAMMSSVYFACAFAFLLQTGNAQGFTIQDAYVKSILVLTTIAVVFFIAFALSFLMRKNFCPTARYWNAKQEYIIDGDKITIHLTGVGVSQSDSFIIRKRKETKAGTILFKSNNYYVVIPHRVQPMTME